MPKKTPGKFRAIMDLSYPHGDAINDFIDKEEFSLIYVTVYRAVGKGCYLNKIDIVNTFRKYTSVTPTMAPTLYLLAR